ncbi:acyl-CoA dehydrogenase family protein [Pyxidicoccus fallax]|uniref:Medium-chain specific acyl-CoA dehydrogenase, mitochondrial n=2 Tax=Pyxidicoccus fallax TaxID=394095 RepID=A0A848LG93_9BACT|nr:acyl-CoA dehydrogenase family protein [Pyxidicoccus fallax]NMO16393.1 acyl-CoA/acyl-ACP dehydrogenase [Pyxidicoccus fallax]
MTSPVITQVKQFVKERVLGNEKVYDSLPNPPVRGYTEFQDLGLANWWVPKAYGGHGLSLEESVDIVEELAYGDAGLAFTLFIAVIGSSAVSLFGSPEQKERFLRPMGEAGITSATLGSERVAGSELLNLSTTAKRAGNTYVINGEKYFSTNAGFADWWMVIAKAPDETAGFKALLLRNPKSLPGVKVERRWPVIGVRGSANYQVSFQDCRVPLDAALEPNGVRILEVGLNPSRTLIAATAIGISRRIRDLCLEYAKDKALKEGTLLRNDVFAAKLGQMEMEIEVMRGACKTAARQYDALANEPDAMLSAGSLKSVIVAKMICGQLGWKIASVGSEMFGGLGYTEDSLIGKLVRDMRYVSIVEGGDDVLRDLLFHRHVLPGMAKKGA